MTLLIEDLSFEAIIGILPFERQNPQKIILNAKLSYEYQGEFLDYVEIVDFLTQEIQNNQYQLLEEALEELSQKLQNHFPTLTQITLSLKKPDILSNCVVGVKINKEL